MSKNSINNWLGKERDGNLADASRKEYKAKKIDKTMLKAAIEKTPDATLEELAEVFGCCFQSIHKRCKKLGITRKKTTLLPTRKKQVKSDI